MAAGRRILRAWADGETDPAKLAELVGDLRLKCSQAELADAIQQLDRMIAEAMGNYAQAVIRLAEAPGFGPSKGIDSCA